MVSQTPNNTLSVSEELSFFFFLEAYNAPQISNASQKEPILCKLHVGVCAVLADTFLC